MDRLRPALERAASLIADYRDRLPEAHVGPTAGRTDVRRALGTQLPEGPAPLDEVVDELVAAAEPGLTASAGPRYFGFVVGGSLDAAVVADLLACGWDQAAFNEVMSPAALAFEDVAGDWLKDVLRLPASASVGFVTGAQAANTVGLAAARWEILRRHGWDVGRDGLRAAPPVRVVAGAERHATIDRSLRLLGLGDGAIEEVPADPNGAMDPAALRTILGDRETGPTIVCAQAGNVNTGACDDLTAVIGARPTRGRATATSG
jgi:glutamate/tyrosine decarboxylase-like PLP-dependent enzyme